MNSKRPAPSSNAEEEETKKQRVENMSEDGKRAAIYYVNWLFVLTCGAAEVSYEKVKEDMMAGTTIMATCYRIHDYARGTHNVQAKSAKTLKRDNQSFTMKVHGNAISISARDALELWKIAYNKYKAFVSRPTMLYNEFFGEVATITALCALFGQRLKEVQLGPDSWVSGKEGNRTQKHNVITYGVEPAYRHLVSGLCWEPSIRNTLAKHTTGLCQLAVLSNSSNEAHYSNKTKVNVVRSFSFLQHIETIANFVQSKSKIHNAGIISLMARITHLHGDKHKRRSSPCIITILNACISETTPPTPAAPTASKMDVDKDETPEVPVAIILPPNCFQNGDKVYSINVPVDWIGFSSKKSVLLYNSMPKIKIPAESNVEWMKELYFHCTFGTHGEDFGVLEFMTKRKGWAHREELSVNNFFSQQLKPAVADAYEAPIIKVVRYAKNISATQNNMLSSSGNVIGNLPMFAGYRNVRVTAEELEFATRMKGVSSSSLDSTAASIIDYLNDVVKTLAKEISQGRSGVHVNQQGRVKWRKVEGATTEKGVNGEEISDIASEIGSSYWAQKRGH